MLNLFRKLLSRPLNRKPNLKKSHLDQRTRLGLEPLEDRLVLSGGGGGNNGGQIVPPPLDIADCYAQLSPQIKNTLGSVVRSEDWAPDGMGRYETFQNGVIYYSTGTGAHALYGDIYNKWLSEGWNQPTMKQGNVEFSIYYPSTDITPTPQGDGFYAHFQRLNNDTHRLDYAAIDDVPQKTFYSLSKTLVASAVDGLIAQKFADLNWETGFGEALTDVTKTPDGAGQYVHFQTLVNQNMVWESIDWTPAYGAHDVNSLMGNAFINLNAEKWGEAITDTLSTPDKQGESNHFVKYVNGQPQYAALDWTKANGIHAVTGGFGQEFANLGWESFGEAIINQTNSSDGVGKFMHFQYGNDLKAIDWTPAYQFHAVYNTPGGDFATIFFQNGAEDNAQFGEAITDVVAYKDNDLTGSYMHFGYYWNGNGLQTHYIDSSVYGTFALAGSPATEFQSLGEENGVGLVTLDGNTNDGAYYCWCQNAMDDHAGWSNYTIIFESQSGTHEMDGEIFQEWSDPRMNPGVVFKGNGMTIVSGGALGYPIADNQNGQTSLLQHGVIQWNEGEPVDWLSLQQNGTSPIFTLRWLSSQYKFDDTGVRVNGSPWQSGGSGSSGFCAFYLKASTSYQFNVESLRGGSWSDSETPLNYTTGFVVTPPQNGGGGGGGTNNGGGGNNNGGGGNNTRPSGPYIVFDPHTQLQANTIPSDSEPFTIFWGDLNFGLASANNYQDYVEIHPDGAGDPNQVVWSGSTDATTLAAGSSYNQSLDIPGLPAGNYFVDVWLNYPNEPVTGSTYAEMHLDVLDGGMQAPPPRNFVVLNSLATGAASNSLLQAQGQITLLPLTGSELNSPLALAAAAPNSSSAQSPTTATLARDNVFAAGTTAASADAIAAAMATPLTATIPQVLPKTLV
jgi:hypothetical protein